MLGHSWAGGALILSNCVSRILRPSRLGSGRCCGFACVPSGPTNSVASFRPRPQRKCAFLELRTRALATAVATTRGLVQVLGLKRIQRPDFDFDGAWLQLREEVMPQARRLRSPHRRTRVALIAWRTRSLGRPNAVVHR